MYVKNFNDDYAHNNIILIDLITKKNPLRMIKLNFEYFLKNYPKMIYLDDFFISISSIITDENYDIKFCTRKYVINFLIKNFHDLLLEDENIIDFFTPGDFHSFRYNKYILKYAIRLYPYWFLLKYFLIITSNYRCCYDDGCGRNRYNFKKNSKYIPNFFSYNFPELITDSTNNFILPLLIEIQN